MTVLPAAIEFWHWWALGGVLAIVEALVPGFVFLWLGIAAGLVGVVLWLWPALGLDFQVLLFAALSVASVVAWRRWQRSHPPPTDQPNLNRRGAQYIGQRFDLVSPITNGRGRVKLGDSSWAVTGPDLPAGQTVEVTGVDGTVLQVRPIDDAGTTPAADATQDPSRPGAAQPPGPRDDEPLERGAQPGHA